MKQKLKQCSLETSILTKFLCISDKLKQKQGQYFCRDELFCLKLFQYRDIDKQRLIIQAETGTEIGNMII